LISRDFFLVTRSALLAATTFACKQISKADSSQLSVS
jgi:hypothetical protein